MVQAITHAREDVNQGKTRNRRRPNNILAQSYDPAKVAKLRRKIEIGKRANSLKIAKAIDIQRQTARKRRVI